jgi:putative oxidoreductase
MRLLDSLRPLSLLLLRFGLGLIFLYYGYPMLFTDPRRTAEAFAKLGLPFPMSYVVGIIEFFGGALVAVGLFTRIAALSLTCVMIGAIWKVHLAKGILAVTEYQFALIVGLAAFTLATTGAGPISIDRVILREGAASKAKPARPKD